MQACWAKNEIVTYQLWGTFDEGLLGQDRNSCWSKNEIVPRQLRRPVMPRSKRSWQKDTERQYQNCGRSPCACSTSQRHTTSIPRLARHREMSRVALIALENDVSLNYRAGTILGPGISPGRLRVQLDPAPGAGRGRLLDQLDCPK